MDFCHLHVHTEYSLLDGLCRIEELVSYAKSQGQTALAITDHGAMYGVVEFYKECQKQGIKPIIGCEVYVAKSAMTEKNDGTPYHLTLLAKNEIGLQNLYALTSRAFLEGFYYKPRIDVALLSQHTEGLVCLSGCMAGEVSQKLLVGDYEGARATAEAYRDLFAPGDYYLEVQNHLTEDDRLLMSRLLRLSEETNIPAVCANDVHYIEQSDHEIQDILLCVQTQARVTDETRLRLPSREFYLKSYAEMAEIFPEELLQNTLEIRDKCNVELHFGTFLFPSYPVGEKTTAAKELRTLCFHGLQARYETVTPQLTERLNYELDTIISMGFADYFLIVWDFVAYAKSKGIPVGPGRGSAVGSLVAYCLNITTVDPIRYGLVFERFLNRERISMPDIDVDFCKERRGEVIDYVISKYGADRVSQIIAFGTLKAKAAVKDVARAMGLPYSLADEITKELNKIRDKDITLSEAMAQKGNRLSELYRTNGEIRSLIDAARKVEGHIRHGSIHAAGILITGEPAVNLVPMCNVSGSVVTQYEMKHLESLGLLKMDFLGIRNLTVIDHTVRQVENHTGFRLYLNRLNFTDEKVFRLLQKGDTDGVFQLESSGMKRFLQEFRPRTFEDLIAAISLYRPGPAKKIPEFIRNKDHPDQIKYPCKELEPILNVTYGCIVYQEQVMEIFRRLAGYTMGQADLIRRAISKKKADVLLREKEKFVEGCQKNGISKEISTALFDEIEDFASYAFNKSHAAGYAVVAYQTAYLKCYYPKEFYAALLSSEIGNVEKVARYLQSAKSRGIAILPPNINRSNWEFTVRDGSIDFALTAIRGVGKSLAEAIATEREIGGEYTSPEDFIRRTMKKQLNKKAMESMIMAGCFDDFLSREEMLQRYEILMDNLANEVRLNVSGQTSMFHLTLSEPHDVPPKKAPPPIRHRPTEKDLTMEKEVLGLYVSGHPLEQFTKKIKSMRVDDILTQKATFMESTESELTATFVGVIQNLSVRRTKTGNRMAIFELEDLTDTIRCIAFPDLFVRYTDAIIEENIIVATGKISMEADDSLRFILTEINRFSTQLQYLKLYLRLPSEDSPLFDKVKHLLSFFSGDSPVYVYFEREQRLTLAPKTLWVSENEILMEKLRNLLGDANVKLVSD